MEINNIRDEGFKSCGRFNCANFHHLASMLRQEMGAMQMAYPWARGKIDFNYHVKPILSDKCFACHGPDVKKRQAEFRLDTEEGAFKALKSDPKHFAIVKGKAEESFLIKRIFSEDPLFQMPPPESNLVLTEQEKDILRKWIEQGAEYKKHWAFIPPAKA